MIARTAEVTVRGTCVRVEVAETFWTLLLGLMFRRELPEGTGMLLRFRRDRRHALHTLNVRFPLDVLFLRADGEVAEIRTAEPGGWGFRPAMPVRYALEVGAGFCARQGVRPGDRCTLPI